jgi:hypothetical protein
VLLGFYPKKGALRFVVLSVAAIVAIALPAMAVAKDKGSSHSHAPSKGSKSHGKVEGAVYTETNDPTGNQIVAFDRSSDGSLKQHGSPVATGGKGGRQLQPGCAPICPILDTQGELALTGDGKLLFAVNAGSNTISAFRVTGHGLKLVGTPTNSNGVFPNSLTVHGHTLYVLNDNPPTPNISGFHFSERGKLTPIAGSTQPLVGQVVPTLARQVGFDNTGRVLVATLLGNPMMPNAAKSIDTFPVDRHGKAGAGTAYDASNPFPFGFAFDPWNHMIDTEVHDLGTSPTGQVATYKVSRSGVVSGIDNEPSNGVAPCWVVITNDGRFAYVVNTGGGAPSGSTVTAYTVSRSGHLTQIQLASDSLNQFAKTDETLSRNSRYLYVLAPGLMKSTSQINEYKVGNNGKLSLVTEFSSPGAGDSGLVGR